MEQVVEIIRDNVEKLIVLRQLTSRRDLARRSGLDPKTINNLLTDPPDPKANPTAVNIQKMAKALQVEAWMLLVRNFPYESIKGRPLKSISPLTYSAMYAIENEPDDVKMLVLEAIASSLCKIDDSASHQIKEVQAEYLNKRRIK